MLRIFLKSVCKQTVCLHLEIQYFLIYDVLSEYLTLLRFATLVNKSEQEFMFRKIRTMPNLGNFYIIGPSHTVMSRTDVQNGFDFHFNNKMSKGREDQQRNFI